MKTTTYIAVQLDAFKTFPTHVKTFRVSEPSAEPPRSACANEAQTQAKSAPPARGPAEGRSSQGYDRWEQFTAGYDRQLRAFDEFIQGVCLYPSPNPLHYQNQNHK